MADEPLHPGHPGRTDSPGPVLPPVVYADAEKLVTDPEPTLATGVDGGPGGALVVGIAAAAGRLYENTVSPEFRDKAGEGLKDTRHAATGRTGDAWHAVVG